MTLTLLDPTVLSRFQYSQELKYVNESLANACFCIAGKYSAVKASEADEGAVIEHGLNEVSPPSGNEKEVFPTFFIGPFTKLDDDPPITEQPAASVNKFVASDLMKPAFSTK